MDPALVGVTACTERSNVAQRTSSVRGARHGTIVFLIRGRCQLDSFEREISSSERALPRATRSVTRQEKRVNVDH